MAELDLELVAGLKAAIGANTDALEKMRRDRLSQIPIDTLLKASGVGPASGNLALSDPQHGPSMSRLWLVRRCIVGGTSWGAMVAGTFELYATGLPGLQCASLRPLDELVDESSGLPNKAYYSNRQVVVFPNQTLIGVIVGPGSGTNYVMAIQAEDYAVAAVREVYGL